MTTWFTSDLHLGHARISELAGRPFESVEEMNRTIVTRWNERVAQDDVVYVLGDVCMGSLAESLELAKTLNGQKLLVPGNHDRVSTLYRGSAAKKSEWFDAYRDAGFTILPDEFVIWLGGNAQMVTLCHFPYDGDSQGDDRYADARPIDNGGWLLHGHTHAKERVRGRQIHVGIDAWNYSPVPENEVLALIARGPMYMNAQV